MGVNKPGWNYLLQEDGYRIELEDGTGFILLEDQAIGCRTSPWASTALSILIFIFAGLYL